MAPELKKGPLAVESGFDDSRFDDDGLVKRTGLDDLLFLSLGTLVTASAHLITAVIGSGLRSVVTCMGFSSTGLDCWDNRSHSLLYYHLVHFCSSR
ncbi:hypothetical protein QYF36_000258 [Acer negundo]|nr:hypothetical protein QYF36_000258 [Acer negundo]